MEILELSLERFRNYTSQTVAFHPVCNVICGENAQGKTNLLEAILYLSCGKSPRARADREPRMPGSVHGSRPGTGNL